MATLAAECPSSSEPPVLEALAANHYRYIGPSVANAALAATAQMRS
jgi:hypothetical protein